MNSRVHIYLNACEKQSKLLLDIAKRGLELAIEQDEQSAEAWMQASDY